MVAQVSRYKELINRFTIKCYEGSKQVPLRKLYPRAPKGDHLEIDFIGLIANIGLLIEVTDQKTKNRKKIKKFLRHCDLFLRSSLAWSQRLEYFDEVPHDMVSEFETAKTWRFVYFGESEELIEEKIESTAFPEADGKLSVFNLDEIEYLTLLSKQVGRYAKFEFLSALGFEPKDFGERKRIVLKFLKLENRILSNDNPIGADVYLLEFTPEELLTVGRVFRYGGISVPFEEIGKSPRKGRYQRILIPEKLGKIATEYIRDNAKICFPNTVTLVLSEGCKEDTSNEKPVLVIPNRYASIDIIDGQHRIFAYAQDQISEQTRKDARILASAIWFKTDKEEEKARLAAKTFWTINSRQATVKRSLLYLIKYEVLGDTDPEAIAGEIIRQCNDTKKRLGRLFKTHPLRKKNKFEDPPIPITTIVQELARLMNLTKIVNDNPHLKDNIERAFGTPLSKLEADPKEKIKSGRKLLEHYFSMVASVFSEDWKPNSNSNLMCANYIAALIRLLGHLMIEKGLSAKKTRKELIRLRDKVRKLCSAVSDSPTFPKNHDAIPAKKIGRARIYEFFINPSKAN